MRHAPLGAALLPEAAVAIAGLTDLPPDHVRAAWEEVRAGRAYRSFLVRGRGGRTRQVDAPSPLLAALQRRLHERVLRVGPVAPAAYAGVPGRSHVDAARIHLRPGRKIVCIDVRDAFARTSYGLVSEALWQRLRRELWTFGLSRRPARQVAAALAYLVTVTEGRGPGRRLPLGAPTSVSVFNLVLLPVDQHVEGLAHALATTDVRYTRYVDDLVLSGPRIGPGDGIDAAVEKRLQKAGLAPHPPRWAPADRAEVHGLTLGASGEVEPTAERRLELARTARARAEVARSAQRPEAARRGARAALVGLDRYLSRLFEARGVERPLELQIAIPPAPPEPPAPPRVVDLLWP